MDWNFRNKEKQTSKKTLFKITFNQQRTRPSAVGAWTVARDFFKLKCPKKITNLKENLQKIRMQATSK